MTAWDESSVRALFGKEKTHRLLSQGLLRPYHTAPDGCHYFHKADVLSHYTYRQPDEPGVGCCSCCGHGCQPVGYQTAAAGGVIVKALSANAQKLLDALDRLGGDHVSLVKLRPAAGLGGSFDQALNELRRAGLVGMAAAEGRYGVSQAERDAALKEHGEMLLFASRKEYIPDIEDGYYPHSNEDEDLSQEYREGEAPPEDEDDEDDLAMEDYIDRRIAVLDRQEKAVAAALDRQADLMALGQASLGLAVGRLRLWDSVRRWLRG
jgi:hypothetical protein